VNELQSQVKIKFRSLSKLFQWL